MERIITITDLPDVKRGTFVIVYEGAKAIDSGVINETRENQGIIVFKSVSTKEPSQPLIWDGENGVWSPAFEDPMTGRMVFSKRSACYTMQEDHRRIPLVLH